MNLDSFTSSHGALEWNNELPLPFKSVRLPGSTVSTSVGDFGSLCIQEHTTDNFSIRFNVFDLLQRFVAKTFSEKTGIFTRLIVYCAGLYFLFRFTVVLLVCCLAGKPVQ